LLTIGEVESITGLSKDTLRKWESRYRFPLPKRNDLGIRIYTAEDLQKIQAVKSLLNRGEKISHLSGLNHDELLALLDAPAVANPIWAYEFLSILEFSRKGDAPAIRGSLLMGLKTLGLKKFVLEFVAPLLVEIGVAWHNNMITVSQEHLCTAEIIKVLSEANSQIINAPNSNKVLLATPSFELHTIGLKMAETMVLLAGGVPVYLGAQTPLDQIIQMANNADVSVVAISISAAYPLREFRRFIKTLDDELPKKINIWIGGAGARELKNSSRIKLLKLEDVATNLGNSGRN